MQNRRASAEIAYPFTAASPYAAGLKDIFLVASGYPVSPEPSVDHGYRDEYAKLASVTVSGGTNTYVFYAISPDGVRVFTFAVAEGLGIVRVPCSETDLDGHIIIDSSRMYDTAGTHGLPAILEVEPAQIAWRLTEIRSITLVNECRHHNPALRVNMPDDRIVLELQADRTAVNTLKLRNGWNCLLTYDELSATLLIEGAPGIGRGLPSIIYWDSNAPDFDTGVLSLNGLANNGSSLAVNNVNIKPGPSVKLTQTAAKLSPPPAESPRLTFTVKAETDA